MLARHNHFELFLIFVTIIRHHTLNIHFHTVNI